MRLGTRRLRPSRGAPAAERAGLRTVELKKQFYATLVDRLNAQAHVRREDVLIVLTEVAKENWSFGNGEAQYT